jgi:hypothetical protein
MIRSTVTIGVVLALSLVLSSCRPLPDVGASPAGKTILAKESAPFKDAIPRNYGKFVGVLQSPQKTGLAVLWFEKPDSTIAVVRVDYAEGVSEEVLLIPRK